MFVLIFELRTARRPTVHADWGFSVRTTRPREFISEGLRRAARSAATYRPLVAVQEMSVLLVDSRKVLDLSVNTHPEVKEITAACTYSIRSAPTHLHLGFKL